MNEVLFHIKIISEFFFNHILFWNLVFAIAIVFFERREPRSVWGWLLLLFFMPILGFILYLFLGQDLRKRRLFRMKELEDRMTSAIRKQEEWIESKQMERENPYLVGFTDLVMYNLETGSSVLTEDNDIDIFIDGNEKYNALIEDLKKAEKFIHIQYYIIKNDVLFNRIVEVLKEKVKQGVEVRVLYDGMGGRFVNPRYWKNLNKMGIQTAEFFPAILGRFHLRINFRNHRKIVVIDNKIGYVGGFNVGKEYIDLDDRFGHWRDTHLRIQGSAVLALQARFVLDWNYAAKENLLQYRKLFTGHRSGVRDLSAVQIITSGPDRSVEQVRDNYLRLISKAKKSIYIQTPYFIPDESIMTALMVACRSGVEVNLMIPSFPDHPFVYWATYSYMGDLVMAGANCYTYQQGFLHCKGMVIDGKVLCYGTANMDIRSFELNFEVNAIVYDGQKAREMEQIIIEDIKACKHITKEVYEERSLKIRVKEQGCRLLSPLL